MSQGVPPCAGTASLDKSEHFWGEWFAAIGHVLPSLKLVSNGFDGGSQRRLDLIGLTNISVRETAEELGNREQVVLDSAGLDLPVLEGIARSQVHGIQSHLVVASLQRCMLKEQIVVQV
jgi:hypothetical protein